MFIGPVAVSSQQRAGMTFHDTYRQGIEAARSQPCFRRYAAIQLLFVPVSLGTSFYSMHASVNHGSSAGSLRVLVISSSVGLIVGSLFWRVVNRTLGPQAILVISGLMGSPVAAICVVIEYKREWDHVWIYGIVFILATIANQAIFTAMLSWMSSFAEPRSRYGQRPITGPKMN